MKVISSLEEISVRQKGGIDWKRFIDIFVSHETHKGFNSYKL